jgi:hypothetical protein
MSDDFPAYVKLNLAAQDALEKGDKQAHDKLASAAYQASLQEANALLIEAWGGSLQELEL